MLFVKAELTLKIGEALHDIDYMTEKDELDPRANPFVLRRWKFMEGALMKDLEKDFRILPHDLAHCLSHGDASDRLPGGPWAPYANAARKRRRRFERYSMAVVGSLILVVPMLLMVLIRGIIVRLVTAGVCTVVFAFAFAYWSPQRTPVELLSVTAAYTAVLVVFVGTTTGL